MAVAALVLEIALADTPVVNDVTRLNPIAVHEIVALTAEVRYR